MLSPDEQLQYELKSDAEASAERLKSLRKAASEGDMSLPKVQRVMLAAFEEVKLSIEAVQASKARGVGGKIRGWIKALPSDLVAMISIRMVVRSCLTVRAKDKPVTIQLLTNLIGSAIELEVRIKEAERVNPMYMEKMHSQVRERGTTDMDHLRQVYMFAYNQVLQEGAESRLGSSERHQIGKFGVQACIDAGMLQVKHGWASKGQMVSYELSPEVWEYLMTYDESDVQFFTDPASGAMLCPPAPWTTLNDGGYMSPRRKMTMPLMPLHRIRRDERKRLRKEFTAEKMPQVFECANYLQGIGLQIHRPTLDAIRRVWTAGGGVMGVPGKTGPKRPDCPFPATWSKADAPEHEVEQFMIWKRSVVRYHEAMNNWRGRVRELSGFIKHTANTPEGATLWFPVFMDTRNRWYYRGSPNPQGSDLSKAVLHLSTKKPLGKRGLFWLKVAIANHFGYDKERFAERAAWVDQNWSFIEQALDDPENHAEVFGTDAPWCLFTTAWELREALRSGNPEAYCTGVPIHMDATCSGIQHFSALLRDPVGGRFVNIYDESFVGPKQDIYGEVATVAQRAAQADLESTDEVVVACATWWLRRGPIERELAKKPVMTYVYGATLRGTATFILDYLEEAGTEFPDYVGRFELAVYMARKLFQGIGATVPSSEYAMQWLRNAARTVPKGKRMEWRSPVGFLVQHDYIEYLEDRLELRSCGVRTMTYREETDRTVPTSMQNAIAPNFVHNLDATHLTLTALDLKAKGLQMLAIHDSFGTHPCDVDEMHKSIRERFMWLYSNPSILADFMMDCDIVGSAPVRGDLDLSRVKSSEFFFC